MIDRCVLIIDDEKRITDSLTDLLSAEDYSVEAANSGADGIAILEQRSFPVVVTDLRMQGIDGLNVIRHIHANQPKTLVIVITGYASTESAIEALHYQAFDYIQKPFDFSHLKASIDRAFHKLEVDQLREDTAAMITHDIKVPLTSVLGFASLMVDKKTGRVHPQAAQFAEKIRSNAQRILALVDNYLASCRIEADNLVIDPSRTRLADMIEDLREIMSHELDLRGFTLQVDEDSGPAEATLDETYVFRALSNFLQNAIKYGDSSEPIVLKVAELKADESPIEKPSLRLEVINLAPGIDPESLKDVFGRFKRAATGSGIEGSGIGLYVVDAVARAHGGKAEAHCLDGGRVSFSIILPLEPEPAGSA